MSASDLLQGISGGAYGNEVSLSEKTLDYLWERQNITANNIANADTPNFKSEYLTFENVLADRVSSAQKSGTPAKNIAHAIDSTKASVHRTSNESSRLDGNNVDMDQEQVQLVKSAYTYQLMVNSVSNSLQRLDSAAKSF
jgi:flagellar basal-body rod protein FlgB